MWVLDHLEDLESDFSVFHRVDNIFELEAPRFFRMATRIFAYDGVMTKRLNAEQGDNEGSGSPSKVRIPSKEPVKRVSLAQMQMSAPGLIERTEVHRGRV